MPLLEKATELVRASSLSEEDKNNLLTLVVKMDDPNLQDFVDSAMSELTFLQTLSENYKRKQAFLSEDADSWKEIIGEEEKYLGSL